MVAEGAVSDPNVEIAPGDVEIAPDLDDWRQVTIIERRDEVLDPQISWIASQESEEECVDSDRLEFQSSYTEERSRDVSPLGKGLADSPDGPRPAGDMPQSPSPPEPERSKRGSTTPMKPVPPTTPRLHPRPPPSRSSLASLPTPEAPYRV